MLSATVSFLGAALELELDRAGRGARFQACARFPGLLGCRSGFLVTLCLVLL